MMFDKASSAYVALGFELIGFVVLLTFLGRYFDQTYGWGGWGVISGVTVAFASWVTHMYIVVQALAKADKENEK